MSIESSVIPPQAVKSDPGGLSFGVIETNDWLIPTGFSSVRVVDERMAYGWNECRKAVLERLSHLPQDDLVALNAIERWHNGDPCAANIIVDELKKRLVGEVK